MEEQDASDISIKVRLFDGGVLLSNLCVLLFSNAVALRRDKSILYNRTSSILFVILSIITLNSLNLLSFNYVISLYGGLFNLNSTSLIFLLFIYGLCAIIIALSSVFPRKFNLNLDIYTKKFILNNKTEHLKIIEYPLIILFIIVGATFLITSNDIVSLFISIELQSYGLYLLIVLYRNSELSTNAGLTYFLLGGLSSCFILLGTSLLYSNSGSTSLEFLYLINKVWDSSKDFVLFNFESNYINYAIVVLIAGFMFKISAAPFHFWSPDVYDAIPTILTTFVAIIPKISVLTFIYSIVHFTNNTIFSLSYDWRYILIISSLLSLIIGTVLGLNQSRIKRLYAYSTISHLGFILLALSINNIESSQAFIFYLMQYSLSNLNAFILLLSIGFSLYLFKEKDSLDNKFLDKNNSPLQLVSQLKGYFQYNSVLAISLAITIYSFVGVPPLLGFFAKQMVLSAALDNGFVFMTLIAILTSVISAVYYLNVIKQIFFDKFSYERESNISPILNSSIRLSGVFTLSISTLTLIILLFILQPQEWLSLTHIMSLISFNP